MVIIIIKLKAIEDFNVEIDKAIRFKVPNSFLFGCLICKISKVTNIKITITRKTAN